MFMKASTKTSLISTLIISALLTVSGHATVPPEDAADLTPLPVGAELPDGTVRLKDGEEKRLKEVLAEQKSILIFYRGGWCPFCTEQLQDLLTIEEELVSRGYTLYGISPDSPASLQEAQDTMQLPYTLLSDSSMELTNAFGLAFRVDEETYDRLQGHGIDLEDASGESHRLLPMPAVYVIDAGGAIQWVQYDPDYRQRLSAEKLLAAISDLD